MKIYHKLKLGLIQFKPVNGINKSPFGIKYFSNQVLDESKKDIKSIEVLINDNLQNKNPGFCSNEAKPINSKSLIKDIQEITKFKLSLLNSLVSVSTFCFHFSPFNLFQLVCFIAGTTSISMTTQVLNQIKEKQFDANMIRTHNRPMPKNRLTNKQAYAIGGFLYTFSIAAYSQVPFFLSAVAFSNIILLLYIFLYTPYKRISNFSMHVGAVTGALPALLGSVAAINSFSPEALLLAGYIFCWQYPHFYGILYPNRSDYKNAGFKFIAADDTKDYIAYKQIVLGMIGMFICVYFLYKKGIIPKAAYGLFLLSYMYKIPAVYNFLSNPVINGKIIRIRSYTPFMIVLLSFLFTSVLQSSKSLKAKASEEEEK